MHLILRNKAAVSGLQQLPIVNAVIDGEDIIYRDYIDISIAVGTPKVTFFCFAKHALVEVMFICFHRGLM